MSNGGLAVLCVVSSLLGSVLSMRMAIGAVKRRISNWNRILSAYFIISIVSFGQRQIEYWRRWGGYDEGQVNVIVKYRRLCRLWIVVSVLGSVLAAVGYKVLTSEG